jgi:hypothetical protein
MKPVIPPKNQNPFHGLFRILRSVEKEDFMGAAGSVRHILGRMKR